VEAGKPPPCSDTSKCSESGVAHMPSLIRSTLVIELRAVSTGTVTAQCTRRRFKFKKEPARVRAGAPQAAKDLIENFSLGLPAGCIVEVFSCRATM
jgi:hypothetical protein